MRLLFLGVALLFQSTSLASQTPAGEATSVDYWYDVIYPKAFFSTRDGLTGGFHFAFVQPLRFDDFGTPPPYRASVGLDAQVSTRGSALVVLDARLPQFVSGWRFVGNLSFRRDARDSYFGIGNDTEYEPDVVTDTQPHFYQVLQARWSARLASQRHITQAFRVLIGVDAHRWKFSSLDGMSVLANDLATAGSLATTEGVTDIAWRLGLVFDTRDDEVFARRGVLLQAIGAAADADIVGGLSYTRLTVSASGSLPVTERLSLAARLLGQGMGGTPGFGTLYILDGVEQPTIGFGGGGSHRALPDNRFIGRHKLLANLDARVTVYSIPTLIEVTAVGFFDVGRVFEGEAFRVTADDVHVGGGAGVFGRLGRAGVVGFTSGIGPDGIVFDFHTRWPF